MSGASKIQQRAIAGKYQFVFPPEVVAENYMMLSVIEKSRPSKEGAVTEQTGRYFILPIPGNLQVQSKMDYEQKSLGGLGALAAGMVKPGAFKEAMGDASGIFQSKMNAIGGIFKDESGMTDAEIEAADLAKDQLLATGVTALTTFAGKKLGGGAGAAFGAVAAGGDVVSGIGLAERIAVNPHLAVLFKNVGLRTFSFQYKFVARSQQESIKLRDMIRALQYHMHPELFVGDFAFKYPDEFRIEFSKNRSERLFNIKQCVLTDLSVNYNGENLPIFFEDTGAPVSVDITMNFQETKIFTKKDYEDESLTKWDTIQGSQQSQMLAEQEAEFNE